MKKHFILLLTFFGTTFLYAQNRTTSLGFTFSGDYTKSLRTGDDRYGYYQSLADKIEGKFGFTTGLSLSLQKNPKRAFDIGLLYMKHHEQLNYVYTGYSFGSYVREDSYLHMVSIPINWVFYLESGKTKPFVVLGVAPTYVLGYTSDYDYNVGYYKVSGHESDFTEWHWDNFYLGATVGIGVSHHFTDDIELRIAPTFRMLSTVSRWEEEFKNFPYFVGGNAGLYFCFGSTSPAPSYK